MMFRIPGNRSTLALAWAVCVILLLIPAMAASAVESMTGRKLLVGGDNDYPPYEFIEGGKASGFNVDVLRAVAEVMGLDTEIRLGPWHEMRRSIESGKINVVTGMYYSPERAKYVDFSAPHIIVTHSIFVRKGSPINTLKDLRGKEVVVQRGDIMHDYLAENGLTDRVIAVESQADALRLLASGRHDAALLSKLQGLYLTDKYRLDNIIAVGPPVLPREYCFAVKKGDTVLLAGLNEGLKIIRSTGRYREIYNTWFGTFEPALSFNRFFRYLTVIIGPGAVILVITIAWSWILKRRVNRKTVELHVELARRGLVERQLLSTNERLEEALRNLRTTEDELREQFGKLQVREALLYESERRFRSLLEDVRLLAVIIDPGGTIVFCNDYTLELTGWRRDEVAGRNYFAVFIPVERRPELIRLLSLVVRDRKIATHGSDSIICRDGSRRLIMWNNAVLLDHDGNLAGVASIGEDVTERVKAEERLKSSLGEKEVLLKEIHHRVKNNLQIISSLINLQTGRPGNEGTAPVFNEIRNRVHSMALVHEQLYRSQDLASIDFSSYIHDLALHLYRSWGVNSARIQMVINVEKVVLGINLALPCGLIVNELISNALKHAFPEGRTGIIETGFSLRKNRYELTVRDNGVGFPGRVDYRSTGTLGMNLVMSLVQQLEGEISIGNDEGTACIVRFPAPD